jgi:hypothetical protein
MTMMFDTPDGIAFVKACSRKGALSLEIAGMHRSAGRQTAYSIVKEVYGFRGKRESVLADLTEYIEAEIRLKHMADEDYAVVRKVTEDVLAKISGPGLSQAKFEAVIEHGESIGAITHAVRQGASDMFYVMIVRQNAGNR